jgi:hypothetical protein
MLLELRGTVVNRVVSRIPGFDPARLADLRRTPLAKIPVEHREMVEAVRRRVVDDRLDVTGFQSSL